MADSPLQMSRVKTTFRLSSLLLIAACTSAPAPAPAETQVAEPASRSATPLVVDPGEVPAPQATQANPTTVPFDADGPRYTWSIAPAPNGTFGFAIYDRGKLYIQQQKATGLAGPDGWKTKVEARTAALAAMEKLENGEEPEGLTIVGQ